MIDEKVMLYEEQSGQPFPPFEHLGGERCERLRELLAAKVGLSDASASVAFVKATRAAQQPCSSLNAEQPDFTLGTAFAACGIVPGDFVLINWAHFNNVDRMATLLVAKHFEDLWYPRADDIDIFDESVDWMMSINYYGEILAFHSEQIQAFSGCDTLSAECRQPAYQ